MSRLRALWLTVALCACSVSVCAAQSSAPTGINTDRPDFTDSTDVVGHHVIQLETGIRFERTPAAIDRITTPQVLVRFGLGSRFELRFGDDGFESESMPAPAGRTRVAGSADAQLGAKVKLLGNSDGGFALAAIPFLSLPTASGGFGTGAFDPGFKLAWETDLPRGFGISGNFYAASATDDARRTWDRQVSVSMDHDLAGSWSAYWEAYGARHDGRCECTLDTGVSRGIGPNRQIDFEVGRGIDGNAHDWFAGLGFAVRHVPR